MGETEVLAHVLLDKRVNGAVRAHRAGNRAERDVLTRVDEAVEVALELPGPAAELHAERHGLGMDAMGATHAQGIALLERTAATDLAELAYVLNDDVRGLNKLIAQGSVSQVGAGHTVVHPAAGLGIALGHIGIDVGAHVGKERDDVMIGDGLDFVHLSLVKSGVLADPSGLLLGNTAFAEFGLRLAGKDLNLLPNGVLVLKREDVAHLGTGIAVDHGGSFLSIGTQRTRLIVRARTYTCTRCKKRTKPLARDPRASRAPWKWGCVPGIGRKCNEFPKRPSRAPVEAANPQLASCQNPRLPGVSNSSLHFRPICGIA